VGNPKAVWATNESRHHHPETRLLCSIRIDGDTSSCFRVVTGVRHGCILSPLLFAIAIDWVLQKTTDNSTDRHRTYCQLLILYAADHYSFNNRSRQGWPVHQSREVQSSNHYCLEWQDRHSGYRLRHQES